MKKLLSIVLTLVLMLTYTMSAFAAGSAVTSSAVVTPSTGDNYKVETIMDTKDYQKIKFTNLKTGDIEYLESFLKNGKYEFLTTNKDGRTRIEKVNGTIKSTNLDTKVIKYQPIITSTSTSTSTSNKPIVSSSIVVRNNTLVVPRIGGWDGIGNREYSSTSTVINNVGATAAALALGTDSFITGGITILATWLVGHFWGETWWYTDHFVDSYDETHFRDDTTFFGYPDYTKWIGSSTFAYYT